MDSQIINVERAPIITQPIHRPPMSPAEFAKGQSTVLMVFEKAIHLTVEHGVSVAYSKGVHEVPEHISDHWYLRKNGAYVRAPAVAVGGSPKK